jgi:hypothetical protein
VTPRDDRHESDFWDALEDVNLDPVQVPMLEALRRIGAPLSAFELVNVLDGYLTMWEAKYHLEVLWKAGVVGTSADEWSESMSDFDLPYHLNSAVSGND